MSFVDGYYLFRLDLVNSDTDRYNSVQCRLCKHPHESLEHLAARVLAFAHCYDEGLHFSEGLYEPAQPTIWHHDVIGTLNHWIQVGLPERKKLEKSIRRNKQAQHSIYFYQQDQIDLFTHFLRGSHDNWIQELGFYRLDVDLVSALVDTLAPRNEWSITILDSTLFLSNEDFELKGQIEPLNMWDEYQRVLLLEQ